MAGILGQCNLLSMWVSRMYNFCDEYDIYTPKPEGSVIYCYFQHGVFLIGVVCDDGHFEEVIRSTNEVNLSRRYCS